MADIKNVFAENLRELRLGRGFTQAELARRANSSGGYITLLESAAKFPSAEMIERIAGALGTESTALFAPRPSQFEHPWKWCEDKAPTGAGSRG